MIITTNTIINTHILCVFECSERPEYRVCVPLAHCQSLLLHTFLLHFCQFVVFSLFLFFFSFSLSRIRLCWGILSRDTLNYSGIQALRQKTWKKRRAFLYCWILGGNSWEGCTHWPCQEGSLLGIKVSNSYLHVHTLLSHKKLT